MPDYSTPNKRKRYIESEFRRLADIVEEMTGKGEATLVHGAFGFRRRNALLAVYDRVEAEFGKLCKGSLLETLLLAELLPLITYNSVNKYNDLTIGAALWILDTMNRTKRFREMTELLPDLTGEDPFYLPLDFNHPSYSNILIQSVMHVLFYKHTEKRKHRWNGEEYDIPTTWSARRRHGAKKPKRRS